MDKVIAAFAFVLVGWGLCGLFIGITHDTAACKTLDPFVIIWTAIMSVGLAALGVFLLRGGSWR